MASFTVDEIDFIRNRGNEVSYTVIVYISFRMQVYGSSVLSKI